MVVERLRQRAEEQQKATRERYATEKTEEQRKLALERQLLEQRRQAQRRILEQSGILRRLRELQNINQGSEIIEEENPSGVYVTLLWDQGRRYRVEGRVCGGGDTIDSWQSPSHGLVECKYIVVWADESSDSIQITYGGGFDIIPDGRWRTNRNAILDGLAQAVEDGVKKGKVIPYNKSYPLRRSRD